MTPDTNLQPPLIFLGQLFDLAGQQAHGIQRLNTGYAMALAGTEVLCVACTQSGLPVDELLRFVYGLDRQPRFHVHANGQLCKGWASMADKKLSDRLGEAMCAWSDPQRFERARTTTRQAAERHPLRTKLAEVERVLVGLSRRSG